MTVGGPQNSDQAREIRADHPSIHEVESRWEQILRELSHEQRRIIQSRAEYKQVIAAAGSGKTRTVIRLAEYELRSGAVSPGRMLLLTFSRKACGEMQERLPEDLKEGIHVATFHGFCYQALKKYHPLGKSFEVVDDEFKLKKLSPLFRRYKYEIGGIPYGLILSHPERFRELFPIIAFRIFRYWHQYKRKNLLLEYDDLISLVLSSLSAVRRGEHSWAAQLLHRYELLVVDEFQDTDPSQVRFLKLLRPPRLVVVGDDWQSIYGFRGADVRPFMDFRKVFPRVQRFYLTWNYRSLPPIVECGNRLIRRSGRQINKTVRSVRTDSSAVPVLSVALDQSEKELRETILRFRQIRVLCRSNYRIQRWKAAGVEPDRLLTIHASKGLEFPVVFLDVVGGWTGVREEENRDEELRTAYVGLTRARNLLVVIRRKEYDRSQVEGFVWSEWFAPLCRQSDIEELQSILMEQCPAPE